MRNEFEALLSSLQGRRIERVTYVEVLYGPESPPWERLGEPFDSVDFGLTLHLDVGRPLAITWGTEFAQYGLSLREGQLEPDAPTRCWDATDRWSGLVGVLIVATQSWWWDQDPSGNGPFPQDVRLAFANERTVTISAFETHGPDFALGAMDHVTIFFDDVSPRRFRLGPFASTVR